MARVAFDEADKYGGQGGAGFFQLKDEGDKAKVRVMYETVDDIVGDSVHEVPVLDEYGEPVMGKNGRPRKQYVNCLREYNDSKEVCPFCRDGKYVTVKLFIPVYNLDENKVQIWERGKTYFKRMTRIASRYDNIVSQVFEIERSGKKGDQQTEYFIEPVGKADDTTLADLPPLTEILGNHVLNKTADDMEYYLTEGHFPPTGDEDEDERPKRRRQQEEDVPVRRRTPSKRSNEDVY